MNSNSVTDQLKQYGFKSTDFFGLLHNVTQSGSKLIEVMFSWVYILTVLGGVTGALVIGLGAVTHHNRWKANGAKILMFSVLAFVVAVFAPGIIISIDQQFNR